MVKEGNPHRVHSKVQLPGGIHIRPGGLEIPGGMVMGNQHTMRLVAHRLSNHLLDIHRGFLGTALGNLVKPRRLQLLIDADQIKGLGKLAIKEGFHIVAHGFGVRETDVALLPFPEHAPLHTA